MVIFTFVRHGESTDNIRSVWAGWKDATLTQHGMNQARAVATSLSETHFTAIHCSDLARASMTAQAIHGKQLADPKPRLIASKLLREQNFGRAEGKPYVKARKDLSLQEHFTQDLYPHLHSRHESFPDGESIDDLAQRAKGVMEEILLPYVWREEPDSTEEVHVAVVSHGLFIRESIMNLLRTYQTEQGADLSGLYSGLKNTAWTRVAVRRRDGETLVVQITHINQHPHLQDLVKQKGIGSAAFDPKQKDIRGFFTAGSK